MRMEKKIPWWMNWSQLTPASNPVSMSTLLSSIWLSVSSPVFKRWGLLGDEVLRNGGVVGW